MPETAYRMTTAYKILYRLCNEKRNSNLRADNPDFLNALNTEFNAREAQIAELTRERDHYKEAYARKLADEKRALLMAHELTNERDSAQALARQAVEVIASADDALRELRPAACHYGYRGPQYTNELTDALDKARSATTAFLARPEVVKIGGGE